MMIRIIQTLRAFRRCKAQGKEASDPQNGPPKGPKSCKMGSLGGNLGDLGELLASFCALWGSFGLLEGGKGH